MDNRSAEEFAATLSKAEKEEQIISEAFSIHLSEISGKSCNSNKIGVEGGVIEGNLPHNEVDRIFEINGKSIKVEIKTSPHYLKRFFTFKVSSLKNCIKRKAIILLFPKADHENFYIIWPNEIQKMLDNKPHEIFRKFSPNDVAVRIYQDEFIKYLKKVKWKKKASNYLEALPEIWR